MLHALGHARSRHRSHPRPQPAADERVARRSGGEWSARVAHGVKIGQLFLIFFILTAYFYYWGEMEGRECKNMKVRTCAVSLSRMHTRACHVYM